eukprot:353454-Chlamydomonas_euryale.AAC.6
MYRHVYTGVCAAGGIHCSTCKETRTESALQTVRRRKEQAGGCAVCARVVKPVCMERTLGVSLLENGWSGDGAADV